MIHEEQTPMVVSTYDKERYLLEVQLRSANKYLKSTDIYLIYCDSSNNYCQWKSWIDKDIKPICPNHNIITYNSDYFFDTSKVTETVYDSVLPYSWVCFAYALKLLASKVLNTNYYWCFDTKVFFFKPTDLNTLKQPIRRDLNYLSNFSKLKKIYNFDEDFLIDIQPPYKFNTKIAQKLVDDNFISLEIDVFGDVVLYQIYCIKNNIPLAEGEAPLISTYIPNVALKSTHPRQVVSFLKNNSYPPVSIACIHHRFITEYNISKQVYDQIIFGLGGKELIPQNTPWLFN